MNKNIPAISIIVPMYNVEKYVGECLDSILAQTFQDFEVIVVDDCSTDKSCEIVENYVPMFDGRLRLIRSEKNSGYPGIPRNIGIRLSRGEYVWFVDSDDAITKTALEELYYVAKNFDADLVHCEKYLLVNDEDFSKENKSIRIGSLVQQNFVDKPTPMSNNLQERLQNLISQKFDWSTVNNFIRRDLLMQYDIKFLNARVCEDMVLAVMLLCFAKTIICTPSTVYIYRQRQNSLTKWTSLTVNEIIKRWGGFYTYVISHFEKIFSNVEVFKQNPEYKYFIFDLFIRYSPPLLYVYSQIPAWHLDPLIRQELEKIEDKTALTAFLFARMNIFNVQINQCGAMINQMNAYIQQQNQALKQQQEIIQKQAEQIKQLEANVPEKI